jgi:signal recognition particle receptor subunit beta
MWDGKVPTKIRPLWREHVQGAEALIFVVDASDTDRIDDAKNELHAMLSDPLLPNCILLVFANKQDLPNVIPTSELCHKLELEQVTDRQWHIQPCTATTGSGLHEGFDWLSTHLGTHILG